MDVSNGDEETRPSLLKEPIQLWLDNAITLEPLMTPENLALVAPGIYRSAFPKRKHFEYLKRLRLRTVLTLVLEDYPEVNTKFLSEQGIQFYQFGMTGNKEPFVEMPEQVLSEALSIMLDKRNHPLLVHCNKGKHRTGCLIGCLRRMQNWLLSSACDEYRRFAYPKARWVDQRCIALFDTKSVMLHKEHLPDWLVK